MTRKKLTPKQRKQVYDMCNGHCAYCGCELDIKNMQVDHVEPCFSEYSDKTLQAWDIERGADDMSNYLPSCRSCNNYKGANDVETFRMMLETSYERLISYSFGLKMAVKYGIITKTPHSIVFYFEKQKKQLLSKT